MCVDEIFHWYQVVTIDTQFVPVDRSRRIDSSDEAVPYATSGQYLPPEKKEVLLRALMAIDRIEEGAVREKVNSGRYRLIKGACVRLC